MPGGYTAQTKRLYIMISSMAKNITILGLFILYVFFSFGFHLHSSSRY